MKLFCKWLLLGAVQLGTLRTASGAVLPENLDLNQDILEEYEYDSNEILEYINSQLADEDVSSLPPVLQFPLRDPGTKTIKDGEIPSYVLEYTPFVHLYSEEKYLPYSVEDYVKHFHLEYSNKTVVYNQTELTLVKLGEIAKQYPVENSEFFLTANEEFDNDPEWITGSKNIPSLVDGKLKNAPAVLIVVDKGNGWVDAYWFYFYSFNLGPFVMGTGPYGNHIGDWEHSLTRFYKGVPVFVWMSAHGGGGAYLYTALEKSDTNAKRPVIFSARGTHANYAAVGQHFHDLPFGMLSDFTDRGSLWDPSLNYLGYTWNGTVVTPATHREAALGDWITFKGHWGNEQLDADDPRQKWSIFEWRYIEGPTGPMTKHLQRLQLCQVTKWFNFNNACPKARHFVKLGQGVEREAGVECGNLFGWVHIYWLRWLLYRVTWSGGICYLMDWIYG